MHGGEIFCKDISHNKCKVTRMSRHGTPAIYSISDVSLYIFANEKFLIPDKREMIEITQLWMVV